MDKPWTVTHNSWEVSTVYDSDGVVVAEFPIDDRADEETQADFEAIKERRARMLVAAPGMLSSLERIAGLVRHLPHFTPREYDANSDEALREMCDALREAVDTAEAALARANS